MTALIDTGVVLAVLAPNDHLHDVCVLALEEEEEPLVPSIILPELAYLVIRDVGYRPLAHFLNSVLNDAPPLVFATTEDLSRAVEIMIQYADSGIDFVDCVIAAMAEHRNITRILTVDQRHFRLFRPRHCPAFELSP